MICPVCYIWYDYTKGINMFDHIVQCKGEKNIITTRWYTNKQLLKKQKKECKPSITIDATFRPVTR